MPRRKEILANEEIYHILNRGIEKRTIFENAREYKRFLMLLQFYQHDHHFQFSRLTNQERLDVIKNKIGNARVSIICYCLMPNHFHLVLKQKTDDGISQFLKIISDGYVKYFNLVHDRVGPLFQGKFKSIRIENDNQLLHLNRYIHINPTTAFITEKPESYQWSSYNEYLETKPGICDRELIMGHFKSVTNYKNFIEDQIDYSRRLKKIDYLTLEKNP